MNSLRLAQLRISPLRTRQVLCASLVLMLTLLAVQQWQWREQLREAAALRQSLLSYHLASDRPGDTPPASVRTLVPVDAGVSQDRPVQLQRQSRWVF